MKKTTLIQFLSSLLLASTPSLQAAINITAPAGGETFAAGDRINVTWNVTGDLIGPGVISLRNEDNRRQFYIIKQNVRLRPAATAECLVPPEIPDGRYRAVIRWGILRLQSSHSPVIHIGPAPGGGGDGDGYDGGAGDGPPGDDREDEAEEEPVSLPDLVITNFQMRPATPAAGEAVEVRFRVRNQGGMRSDPCKVRWTPADRSSAIPSIQKTLPPINPGGDRLIQFNFRGYPARIPSLTTRMTVDSENAVTESNEANNTLRRGIVMAPAEGSRDAERSEGRPDLVVTNFSLNPRNPAAREDVRVTFRVYNRGDARSRSCEAQWVPAIGHPIIAARNMEIPAMNPGAGLTIRYTFRGYPLRHSGLDTKVTVDHEREIAESNEGNNTQRLSFRVGH